MAIVSLASSGACLEVGAERSHLDLFPGPAPGLKRLAFAAESAAALEALAERLRSCAVAWQSLHPVGIRVAEPNAGVVVDFIHDTSPGAAGDGALLGIGHVAIRTPRYRESTAFWRDILGFRVSDEIDGRITFLRCFPNPLHHSLAIARGERATLHHLNLRVRARGDVDAAADGLRSRGATILRGPANHLPSGSRFVYCLDPDGLTLEISAGSEDVAEGSERPPRMLPDRPESIDDDATLRDTRMFAVGEIEAAS